ncbi:hypothetical protein BLA29_011365 [Euroglyphus maynei]|uniref:Uncharacterized protein n=1 Tax=Euroglyphus maynei TaxID=6958 RepID=A0A1Y3BHG3_EURMA|nr:hypothetical protein BLA29_011365 [Euroglyphus maynei]
MDDSEDEYIFDFDNDRPIKKYICEDKVLEIFDRMHIREGEHYIVEDVKDDPLIDTNNNNNNNSGIHIEEIDDNNNINDNHNAQILEMSTELRDAFANQQPSLTDKLIKGEQEKLSKALVVWESNSIMKLLTNNNQQEIDSDDDDHDGNVRIEEPLDNDLDNDQMFDDGDDVILLENDYRINPTIEQYKNPYVPQDQPME